MSETQLNLTEGSLKALVESLAYDVEFRRQASLDPSEALSRFGVEISPTVLPGPIHLAPRGYYRGMLMYLEHGPPVVSFFQVIAALFAGHPPPGKWR